MAKKSGLSFSRKKRKKFSVNIIREIFSWAIYVALAIGIGILLTVYFGMQVRMVGTSMEPTIENSEMVLVNKVWYLFSEPKKDDIIVFLPNGNEYSHYYVKRVVAGPGDTLQIKNGRLYVNGEQEEDLYDKMQVSGIAADEITVGDDEYFVLGDNRNSGEDSRSGNIGLISEDLIEGKAWFRYGSEETPLGFVN